MAKLLNAFYGVWNFDFLRTYHNNVCFRINSASTILLDLGVAIYLVVLMLVTYLLVQLYELNYKPVVLLCSPFQSCLKRWYRSFSVRNSIVNVYATFMSLSPLKFFILCCDILTPLEVYQFTFPTQINVRLRLYYYSTVEYSRSEHYVLFFHCSNSNIHLLPTSNTCNFTLFLYYLSY